jgi:hypothetical protein
VTPHRSVAARSTGDRRHLQANGMPQNASVGLRPSICGEHRWAGDVARSGTPTLINEMKLTGIDHGPHDRLDAPREANEALLGLLPSGWWSATRRSVQCDLVCVDRTHSALNSLLLLPDRGDVGHDVACRILSEHSSDHPGGEIL